MSDSGIDKIKTSVTRSAILSILLCAVLIGTFKVGVEKRMDQTVLKTVPFLHAISIAISETSFGTEKYTGRMSVLKRLKEVASTNSFNYALQYGLGTDINGDKRLHIIWAAGSVTYYKWAFKIFGNKTSSIYYFHFLVLSISIFIFITTFFRKPELLFILLLFVCAHLLVVLVIPYMKHDLSLNEPRAFPLLSIIPSLYLAFIILCQGPKRILVLPGVVVQVLILLFILHARITVVYQVVFLASIAVVALLWNWNQYRNIPALFKKVNLWPLLFVFIGVIFLKYYYIYGFHPAYKDTVKSHLFWPLSVSGLGAHPDSKNKSSYKFLSDQYIDDAMSRRANERGLKFKPFVPSSIEDQLIRKYNDKEKGDELVPGLHLAEELARDEFFDIFKEDPWFVIGSYYHKAVLFLKVYFGFPDLEKKYYGDENQQWIKPFVDFHAMEYLFEWYMLLIVFAGMLLVQPVWNASWYLYSAVLFFEFILVSSPTIFFVPHNVFMACGALMLTLIIYLFIAITLNHFVLSKVLPR